MRPSPYKSSSSYIKVARWCYRYTHRAISIEDVRSNYQDKFDDYDDNNCHLWVILSECSCIDSHTWTCSVLNIMLRIDLLRNVVFRNSRFHD